MHKLATISIWLLIFTIPWQNMIMVPGVGTINRAVGLSVIGILIFSIAFTQTLRAHLLHGLMLLLAVWSGISFFWSIDPDATIHAMYSYSQFLVLTWILYQWGTTEREIRSYFQAYVVGCWVSVGGTLFVYLTSLDMAYKRYAAVGFDQNDLAVIMALGIPMSWYLASYEKQKLLVLFYRLYPAVALFAILLTASRAGFVVSLISLVFLLWTYTKASIPKIFLYLVGFVFSIIIIANYAPIESLTRIQTTGSELVSGTLGSRTNIWNAGLEILNEETFLGLGFLWGKGMGTFQTAVSTYLGGAPYSSHNVYLSLLIEVGVIGFLIFTVIFALSLYIASRLPPYERLFWLVLLAQWAAAAMTLSWLLHKGTWLLIGLLVAHAATMQYRRDTYVTKEELETP